MSMTSRLAGQPATVLSRYRKRKQTESQQVLGPSIKTLFLHLNLKAVHMLIVDLFTIVCRQCEFYLLVFYISNNLLIYKPNYYKLLIVNFLTVAFHFDPHLFGVVVNALVSKSPSTRLTYAEPGWYLDK